MKKEKKSPLKEVLFDINFVPSAEHKWDITFFGKFYSLIEDEYKERQELEILSLPLGSEDIEEDCETKKMMRFKKEDRTRIIQIGENKLVFNIMPPPYPGWANLKPEVIIQIKNYCKVCAPERIESLGVRYVNRFDEPSDNFDLKQLFRHSDYLPRIIFENRFPFFFHFEHPFKNSSKVEINFGNVKSENENEIAIIFDLEVQSMQEIEIDDRIINVKLEKYHNCLKDIFKDSISHELREKIGVLEE